ncbi:MAG: aldose epimerase [Pseudoxanthomonas sp.]
MQREPSTAPRTPQATAAFARGPVIEIAAAPLRVTIAPQAGGRIAQINYDGTDHLVDHDEGNDGMIAWGSFPMLPWAGRLRRGRFEFEGRSYRMPLNMGDHAIHGPAFGMPWQVDSHHDHAVELSLALPQDARWPFGGSAHQRIEAGRSELKMTLSLKAGECAMPGVIGWHPWFRKPDRVVFTPSAIYPRDEEGIATLPVSDPSPGPWDDCFVNTAPVLLQHDGRRLRLTSDCTDWVVYDEAAHATCIEPQSGPPDAFNLQPTPIAPGESLQRWFLIEWES